MDESSRQALLSRRHLLTAGALSTGAVWVAPIVTGVNMASAHAASGPADRARPGQPTRPGNNINRGGGHKPQTRSTNSTTNPGNASSKANSTTTPANSTTEPGNATTKPANSTNKPGTATAKPVAVAEERSTAGAFLGPGNSSGGGATKPITAPAPPVTKDRTGGLAKTGG